MAPVSNCALQRMTQPPSEAKPKTVLGRQAVRGVTDLWVAEATELVAGTVAEEGEVSLLPAGAES